MRAVSYRTVGWPTSQGATVSYGESGVVKAQRHLAVRPLGGLQLGMVLDQQAIDPGIAKIVLHAREGHVEITQEEAAVERSNGPHQPMVSNPNETRPTLGDAIPYPAIPYPAIPYFSTIPPSFPPSRHPLFLHLLVHPSHPCLGPHNRY